MLQSILRPFLVALLVGVTAAQTETRVTVNVACDDGIVEGTHTVTVTVSTIQPPTQYTVTVSVPEFSDSEGICGELADKLNDLEICCCEVTTAEIDRPSSSKPGSGEPSPQEKVKRHDLVLPACLQFVKASHTRNGRPTNTGQLTIAPAVPRSSGFAPADTTLTIDILQSQTATVLTVGVFCSGVAESDSVNAFVIDTSGTPLAQLGQWFGQTYGATVSYPTPTSVQAVFPAALNVDFCFCDVGENITADPPDTHTQELAFAVLFQ